MEALKQFAAESINRVEIKTGTGPGQLNFDGPKNADLALTNILNTVYFWAGVVAVIVIIIGAYYYVTSNGDQGTTTKAKNAILGAVIGLVVIILASTITNFVIGKV